MSKYGLIWGTLLMSSFSNACEMYGKESASQSVVVDQGVCFSFMDSIGYTAKSIDTISHYVLEESTDYASYWSDWLLDNEASPILSKSLASNYIGLGVWVPSELEDELASMDTEEWIRSHGLQLSLGFGDMNTGQPRMRVDYRWHDQREGDVMMQVEVPF
ncbi:hypothetical protein EJ063_05405 [Vibrio aquaticus]|uniref:Uncharacterized protein n=1 Tax=Vibrio aquaticus TaxID=2496559 RepID=A0A3S0MM42_9VIBR|nr:hypothetical protein [Vibrio aquaticus]RTZ18224.1 hypothetical protein EJ063_05405 [Vibrio aquaticus]